jgi:ferredoxin
MAYKITEECINCDACVAECPNQAITEEEIIYVIDPARCTECIDIASVPHCVEICPVDCCIPDPDYKETEEQLRKKKERLEDE